MRTIDAIRLRTEVDNLLEEKVITPLTMKRMHTLIDSQPTVDDSGWIDCAERLPEKNGHYTVTQERYSIDDNARI